MDTIPNLQLTTAEKLEIAKDVAVFKTTQMLHDELIERVQKIADAIDARDRRAQSKDKWFANVMNYALAEFKKYFL